MMKNASWIALAVALATMVAGAVAWRLHTAQSRLAPIESSVGNMVREAPPDTPMPPQAGMPKHLRRLLATRLGRPRVLSLRNVHTTRNPQYAGVACGEVAWGDASAKASDYKPFVASRRTVHLAGAAGFDALWNKICVKR
jgi:hypothetical protein